MMCDFPSILAKIIIMPPSNNVLKGVLVAARFAVKMAELATTCLQIDSRLKYNITMLFAYLNPIAKRNYSRMPSGSRVSRL